MMIRKREVYGPPADARLKYPGGSCGLRGSNRANYSNKSLVQCVGAKVNPPGVNKSRTGLYHRKCVPPGRNTKYNHPYLSSLDANKSCGSSTCPPTFRVDAVTPRCRKSLSMVDLSPGGIDHESGDLRSESSSTSLLRTGETVERTMEHGGAGVLAKTGQIAKLWLDPPNSDQLDEEQQGCEKKVAKAASTVCHLLAINAWRRRREEVNSLQQTVEQLGQQVDHLHIQIVVLRRLLHTENSRVEKLNSEAHQAKNQLDESTHERDRLRAEKDRVEEELKQLKGESEVKSVATENLRNELMTLKSQVEALDKQISRDREKLLKLREDKKILLEKLSTTETLANERGIRADKAEANVQELQGRLNAQETRIETLQQDNRKCTKDSKATELEKLKLEKRLRLSEDSGRALGLRAANLEMQLSDREAALRRIESAYNLQLKELTEIRERVVRESQEVGWSSRVLQIAGSVVWAPRAILRSLSFLSSSGSH